jgi:hypothetical protein
VPINYTKHVQVMDLRETLVPNSSLSSSWPGLDVSSGLVYGVALPRLDETVVTRHCRYCPCFDYYAC